LTFDVISATFIADIETLEHQNENGTIEIFEPVSSEDIAVMDVYESTNQSSKDSNELKTFISSTGVQIKHAISN